MKLDVVGVGMNVMDLLIRIKEMPTWENTGRPSKIAIDGGGLVATALVTAQKFGMRTGFIGSSGNDQMGMIKHQLLAKYGVDLSHEWRMPYPENQLVIVYVDETSGERYFSAQDNFWDHFIDPATLDRDYITGADFLHVDGYHFEAGLQAAKWMRAAGKPVMYDAGRTSEKELGASAFELVRQTDYLICGSGFLRALTGIADLWEAGPRALEMGPRVVVQTEGEDGSYTFAQGESFHVPAFPIDAVDTTGAGDVFHGAYLYGLSKEWDLHTITLFATAASALECTQMGGRISIPSLEQVFQFLSDRGINLEE
ncbi:MAG: hypothetical protein JW750_01185 [Anaerolineaceae bacterium]|nr:hypothetical protein [Anaerolineaceae bacterium]